MSNFLSFWLQVLGCIFLFEKLPKLVKAARSIIEQQQARSNNGTDANSKLRETK